MNQQSLLLNHYVSLASSQKSIYYFSNLPFQKERVQFQLLRFSEFSEMDSSRERLFLMLGRIFWPFCHKHRVQVFGSASVHHVPPKQCTQLFPSAEIFQSLKFSKTRFYMTQCFTLDEEYFSDFYMLCLNGVLFSLYFQYALLRKSSIYIFFQSQALLCILLKVYFDELKFSKF